MNNEEMIQTQEKLCSIHVFGTAKAFVLSVVRVLHELSALFARFVFFLLPQLNHPPELGGLRGSRWSASQLASPSPPEPGWTPSAGSATGSMIETFNLPLRRDGV